MQRIRQPPDRLVWEGLDDLGAFTFADLDLAQRVIAFSDEAKSEQWEFRIDEEATDYATAKIGIGQRLILRLFAFVGKKPATFALALRA